MVGRIRYVREKGKSRVEEGRLWGLNVLTVTLHEPEGLGSRRLERRLDRVERDLLRAGVRRVILPEHFPHGSRLERLRPVTPLPLYRGVADLLALRWLEGSGIPLRGSCVALKGVRLCPELTETARRLCSSVREIRVDVPGEEGERFARLLHWEYGIPVVPQTAPAAVAVSFGGREDADLRLYGDAPHLGGLTVTAPGLALPQPVMALLWERGRLRREEIQVKFGQNSCQSMDLMVY